MMKKILYLGKDDNYVDGLNDRIGDLFPLERYDSRDEVPFAFEKILTVMPSLVLIEFPGSFSRLSKLINLVRLNQSLVTIPLICFVGEQGQKELDRVSLYGGVLYFIKNVDQDDVIYAIQTLLAPELMVHDKVAKAVYQERTNLIDVLRIRSMSASFATFETNRIFNEGSEVKVQIPFFKNLFRFNKHRITTRSTSDIHSPSKYSYRLEYLFCYDELRPEERIKLLTEFKYQLEKLPIKEFTFELIQEFEKKPKKFLLVSDSEPEISFEGEIHVADSVKRLEISARTIIFNWVFEQAKGKSLTKDSITVYHQSYGLLRSGTPFLDRENTTVQMRQLISRPQEDLLKDKPSVIAVFVDEVNTLEKVSELVQAATLIRDYFPFFILFNYASDNIEEVRSKLQYHFIIITKVEVNESVILKMLELFRKKKQEKDLKRIYKFLDSVKIRGIDLGIISEQLFFDYKAHRKIEDKESYAYLSLPIEIKWLSEFEVLFSSEQELSVGEILILEIPLRLHILIIPHQKDSKQTNQKNFYRGLVHFLSDTDKKILRRFVSQVATLSSARGRPLVHDEVIPLKKQLFSLIGKI